MSEQPVTWHTTPKQVQETEYRHAAIVEGLTAIIDERTGWIWWHVSGLLGEFEVQASGHIWAKPSLDEVKATVARAAATLREAGVRPGKATS